MDLRDRVEHAFDVPGVERNEVAAEEKQVWMGVGENPTRRPDRRRMRARSPVKVRHERDAKWRWCGIGRREDEVMARDPQPTLQAERTRNPRWPPAGVHEIVQVLEAPLLRTEPERASEP